MQGWVNPHQGWGGSGYWTQDLSHDSLLLYQLSYPGWIGRYIDHDQHIEANTVQVIILDAIQCTTLVELYSCNVQGIHTLDMQEDP